MNKTIDTFENLMTFKDEYEWLDFKENWFSKDEIGEYISALSNGAALCGKEFGYIVWGIRDNAKEIVGTTINLDKDIDGEPYKHYLARKLKPSIAFEVKEFEYNKKRIVMLIIPAAKSVKTKFNDVDYIRIGSSKEKLNKFPEYEIRLNNILVNGYPTIVNMPAPDYAQELTFQKLFVYYASKGIILRDDSFEKSLKLRTKNGLYNIMAYVLSDQNNIPMRVSVFSGIDKASPLYSVKEFGNTCIFYTIDKILEYGDTINIIQADERNRITTRNDIPLFDFDVYREAVLNAFIHNKWLTLNAPAVTVYTDRIEILSHGGLAIDQDIEGFYSGSSLPVNEILATLFLQLRISERSGRGVPKIISVYGKESIKIEKNRITVTIPFNKINANEFHIVSNKVSHKVTNKTEDLILELIRDNPNITIAQLMIKTNLSEPGVKKNLKKLKEKNMIRRVGANKDGYWEIIE